MNKTNLSVVYVATLMALSAQAQTIHPLQSALAALDLKADRASGQFAKVRTAFAGTTNPGDRFGAADALSELAMTSSDSIIPAVLDGNRVQTRIQFTNVDTIFSTVNRRCGTRQRQQRQSQSAGQDRMKSSHLRPARFRRAGACSPPAVDV